jgi:hypothetical protein
MTDEEREKMADRLVSIAIELAQMRVTLLLNGRTDGRTDVSDRAAFRLVDESQWRLVAAAAWLRPIVDVNNPLPKGRGFAPEQRTGLGRKQIMVSSEQPSNGEDGRDQDGKEADHGLF